MINKKNCGSSLIYMLILLATISLVCYGFSSYVISKKEIIKMKNNNIDKKILKKRLIKKEKRQMKSLAPKEFLKKEGLNRGYEIEDKYVSIGTYFNSCFVITETIHREEIVEDECDDPDFAIDFDDCVIIKETKKQTLAYEHIMYNNKKSIGEFSIQNIKSANKTISLPLKKNVNYGTLEVTYVKNMLGIDLVIKEKINFKLIHGIYVPNTIEYKFLNEDKK